MPISLNCHLSDGITYEALETDPDETFDGSHDVHYDSHHCAAKRRRIEKIATEYLRGKPPIILSACLKGPLNGTWKNPWSDRSLKKRDGPRRREAGLKTDKRSKGVGSKSVHKNSGSNRVANSTRVLGRAHSRETSRNAELSAPANNQEENQAQIRTSTNTLPAYAHPGSNSTEYFSANVEVPNGEIPQMTDMSCPQWLKRSTVPSRRSVSADIIASPVENLSPTPSRPSRRLEKAQERVRGATSEVQPVGSTDISPNFAKGPAPLNKNWMPSASASLVTSLPAKQLDTTLNANDGRRRLENTSSVSPISKVRERASSGFTPINPRPTVPLEGTSVTEIGTTITPSNHIPGQESDEAQFAQLTEFPPTTLGDERANKDGNRTTSKALLPSRTGMMERDPTVLNRPQRNPEVVKPANIQAIEAAGSAVLEGSHSAKRLSSLAAEHALVDAGSTPRPSFRYEVQRSAERCATANRKRRTTRKSSTQNVTAQSHDLVASPAPASSTGFTYRKIGESRKAKDKAVQKRKPRPVTFTSSPASPAGSHEKGLEEAQPNEPVLQQGDQEVEEHANLNHTVPQVAPRPDIYDVQSASPTRPEHHGRHQTQEGLRSSRVADFSTQAAMMQAQLEFQQGTFPSVASGTPRLALHSQDETLRPHLPHLSPATTSFHAFNAELNKKYQPDSVFQASPMSTQELFMAASPFAFSNVKKKPARLQGSGLRFAVLSNDNIRDDAADRESLLKSPTASTERIPLKERNSSGIMKSAATEGEKGSQDLSLQAPRSPSKMVGLPELDFRTSSDHAGVNAGMGFGDRFLLNLDGIS
ncbi:hypothetical protein K469DRAFT_700785 [Zopfia rhizophila CBS 207.26]|uniref:Uncharacterized protein n=1 Tax=Zopfia rhizophila CBS 207.26 TaxID=1314779 RepID=A0A6A6EET2_9PEZI|nr:hypothetical protein K469DRAFT_700785 [Zopfia rhizophila CBS 207.26]